MLSFFLVLLRYVHHIFCRDALAGRACVHAKHRQNTSLGLCQAAKVAFAVLSFVSYTMSCHVDFKSGDIDQVSSI